MSNDAELLEHYAREGSEADFVELVGRHLNLVYGAALRQAAGSTALAEDITQAVFTELARKAATLKRHPALSGWLYTCVRHTASNYRRSERRRQQREQTVCMMSEHETPDRANLLWDELKPVLDDALHSLADKDRTAVVLRFLQERSFREVGEALGLAENAARMRVDRALEKLRGLLAQRGITSTASGLATALTVGTTFSAPSGMAASVASSAMATVGISTAGTSTTIATIMTMTKVKVGLAAILVTAGVGVPMWQRSQVDRLEKENANLQAQLAGLPALHAEAEQLRGVETDRDEIERLREEQWQMTRQIARLRGQLSLALAEGSQTQQPQAATAAGAQSQASPPVVLNAVMRTAMESAMEQQTLGKLPRLKERLDLSPEQESAVKEILTRQFDQGLEIAQKMMAGELTRDDMQEIQGSAGDPEGEIEALLSADQLAAYQEHKHEEASSNARLVANGELLQMQTALGLTFEQQDQVFDAIYQHTLAQLSDQTENTADQTGNPELEVQKFVDQKVQVLESILTPEQLEQYRKIQENQLKLVTDLLPRE